MKEKKQKNSNPLDFDKKIEPENNENPQVEVIDAESPEAECCNSESKDSEKDKQIADLTDRLQRSLAEFDNFRKRTQKEKSAMYNDGVSDTVLKLLPVVDNFERALSSDPDKSSGFYKGVDMIYKQLQGSLKELGIEEIPTENEGFDPNIHYAVTHVDDEKYGENEVIDTLCKGYKYKEKVIRPAMVKVAN